MIAAILKKPGSLEIKEIPLPVCSAGGVLVKVKACGICAADAKMAAKGHRALIYPRILGHEIAGIVCQSRTSRFREGDRVQVAPGLRCGTCPQCRRGADNRCEHREILGFTQNGGFADVVSIPIEGPLVGALTLLPDDLTYADACLAEPLACCLNAQDRIDINGEDTVLIMGAGPLGLLHAVLSGVNGAGKVLIAEIEAHRREAAKYLLLDGVFDSTEENFFQTVSAATDQKGVDVIIFACSEAVPDDSFLELLAPGGRVSLFSGISPLFSRPAVDVNRIHYNEIVISGAYGCTADQNRRAVDLIALNRLPVQDLITQRVNLENILQGLEHTKSRKALKSIVEVQDEC